MTPRADAVRNRAKILAAAAQVFAAHGAATSTEEVAAAAGVAIGTVFRHFPTKQDLLTALLKDTLAGLTALITAPDATLFGAFTALIAESAAKRSMMELVPGLDLEGPISLFRDEVGALLSRAQQAGQVRAEIRVGEVMALLISLCQGALRDNWPPELQQRTLAIVFTGLATAPATRGVVA